MKRAVSDNILILYVITFVLIFLGQILGSFLQFILFLSSSPAMVTMTMYLTFIGIWGITLLLLRFTKNNRPILNALGGRPSGNNWKWFLLGIGIGFGLIDIFILVACLFIDISLYFDSFQPISVIGIFIAVFVQSSAEELLCRGFLYQRLMRSYKKPIVAIVGNSLFFALLHLANDGITILSVVNIFVVGILFSLMVYYMDSIWCAMAMHTAWNFTQNILFGLPNSGMVAPYSILRLDASTARDSFAYNVGFGIEGTLLADIVLILACVCLYLWGRKYGKKPYDVWEENAPQDTEFAPTGSPN